MLERVLSKGKSLFSCGNVNWYSHYREQKEDSFKTKTRATIWSSNLTPGHIYRKNKKTTKHNLSSTCTPVFPACMCICSVMSNSLWPGDYRVPGSFVYGILQASIPEQVVFSPSGDIPNPGIKPMSLATPALAGRLFTSWATMQCCL